MERISAVYEIINVITGDSYVGSTKDVNRRWANHKYPSQWVKQPNNRLYKAMQKYGLSNFSFRILTITSPECLRKAEQDFIRMLKPAYNINNANGLNVKKRKESLKKYRQSNKGKENRRKSDKEYFHQLCFYNGEKVTFGALAARFRRTGISHPNLKAKQYLIK